VQLEDFDLTVGEILEPGRDPGGQLLGLVSRAIAEMLEPAHA
jgi:hypothetical protein